MELDELLALARDKSVDGRARLVQTVGDLFFETDADLSDRERALMTEILRQLIHEVEMSVRKQLADKLADNPKAPTELITTLANDEIEVAYPVLLKSSVLQDIELIEIIRHRTMRHQLAIAMREAVSEDVSNALVETGNEDVIKKLLENQNADISKATMDYLVDESRRVDAYQNPLVHRDDLTEDMARRMYMWVSAALRNHIVSNFGIDPTELEQNMEEVVLDLVDGDEETAEDKRKSSRLAELIKKNGGIDAKLLIQTLRQGEIPLFEALLAEAVNLRPKLIQRFIFEPGGQGLAICAKAIEIDKADFATMFLLSRSARPGEKVVDPNELTRAISFFERVEGETAQKVIHRWRLDPDFLYALKQVPEEPTKAAG